MTEDLWAADPDARIARVEGRLSNALSTYLYRVHQSAHILLGLPQVDAAEIQAAYRTPVLPHTPMAKADPGWSKAAQLFEELMHQPRSARKADELARALTESWYERGLIDDHARRAVVQANLIGRIRAGGDVQVRPWTDYESGAGLDRQLAWAQERACEYAVGLKAETRRVLGVAVYDALLRGDSPQTLAVDLTHRFGVLNRDARRLAVTEVSFARSNGFLMAVPVGEEVEWFAAKDACSGCNRLHGRKFMVSAGPADPEKYVWVGKHNVGLKAGERTATIPLHPNCRCRWVRVSAAAQGVSARVLAALDAIEQLSATSV